MSQLAASDVFLFKHPDHPEVFARFNNGLIRQLLAVEFAALGSPWPSVAECPDGDYVHALQYAKAVGYAP